jgi:hypothetical protein
MGKMVASFNTIAASSGPDMPYQDLLCFAAAVIAVICLVAAAGVCLCSRRETSLPAPLDD